MVNYSNFPFRQDLSPLAFLLSPSPSVLEPAQLALCVQALAVGPPTQSTPQYLSAPSPARSQGLGVSSVLSEASR